MEKTKDIPIIVETIEIEAPIGVVFAALTEPSELVQWWGQRRRIRRREDGARTHAGRRVEDDGNGQRRFAILRRRRVPCR